MLLAADRLNVWPLNNAPGCVVNLMNPANVDAVFIAGQVRKWRGNLVGVDADGSAAWSRVRAMASSSAPDSRRICWDDRELVVAALIAGRE